MSEIAGEGNSGHEIVPLHPLISLAPVPKTNSSLKEKLAQEVASLNRQGICFWNQPCVNLSCPFLSKGKTGLVLKWTFNFLPSDICFRLKIQFVRLSCDQVKFYNSLRNNLDYLWAKVSVKALHCTMQWIFVWKRDSLLFSWRIIMSLGWAISSSRTWCSSSSDMKQIAIGFIWKQFMHSPAQPYNTHSLAWRSEMALLLPHAEK